MMSNQLELLDIGKMPPRSREGWIISIAERMHHCISLADGCCEPDYDDKPVALGNWNNRTRYDKENNRHVVIDDTMPRIAKLLEKLGYECQWGDEWGICEKCGKALRTQPDSYSWNPHYVVKMIQHGVFICRDCFDEGK